MSIFRCSECLRPEGELHKSDCPADIWGTEVNEAEFYDAYRGGFV